jgi:hypothetical protein
MPPSIRSCPHCGLALTIPQPPPERIACPRCRQVFTSAQAGAGAVAAGRPPPAPLAPIPVQPLPSAPSPVPARHGKGPILVLAGFGVLIVAGLVAGAVLLFQGEPPPAQITAPPIVSQPPPKPPPPPDPRIKIVQPAVDRGVAFLKGKVPTLKGMRCGYVGLNGLALLECGVSANDPGILQIAEFIRAAAPGMNQVYDLASSLFFLNRWNEDRPLNEADRKMARTFALRIIAGQLTTGLWGYGGVLMNPEQEGKLLTSLQQGTYKPTGAAVASMSNTQFAMLAVWGARKHGVPVRAPLLALAAYFHANQQPDGCWNYPNYSLKATSTCAGLIALAVEKVLLEDKEFTKQPHQTAEIKKKADVNKAFEFVARTIGRKKEDPGGGTKLGYGGGLFDADAIGDLYFLWTLERVGVIYSKELIGGKNWYDWAYPIVMKAQLADGSWNEPHNVPFGPLIDTPFALLFLKRANIAKDLTDKLRELLGGARAQTAPRPAQPARKDA